MSYTVFGFDQNEKIGVGERGELHRGLDQDGAERGFHGVKMRDQTENVIHGTHSRAEGETPPKN